MARTRLLTHDSIAAAAFELVDTEGAGALTIARLAERLGVAQMTLYNYAAGKREIVNMLPDVLLADLPPIDRGTGWRDQLGACFAEVHDRLVRHGNVTQLIAGLPVASDAQTKLFSEVLALLDAAGFSGRDALTVHRTLSTYTLGFALFQIAENSVGSPRPGTDAAQFRAGLRAVLSAFSPDG
ncbi:TetR/AcrR family transcriptional regulator C-terminal domain-containing protein [Mycobacterium sp.]|uniref:TetR/AcrR family transcriptional regulator C-terminal domain-containing protein n=1 Tax=Mycobacterium sp. TaxID=1785 RepID=UPI0025E8B37C|nr:TetR/AcrR family transcriptional regulator C-terminal domain-containing protein [Mycobacterium sp.]